MNLSLTVHDVCATCLHVTVVVIGHFPNKKNRNRPFPVCVCLCGIGEHSPISNFHFFSPDTKDIKSQLNLTISYPSAAVNVVENVNVVGFQFCGQNNEKYLSFPKLLCN